jgi:hypothetical protein
MLAGVAETYVFLRRWKEAEDNARHAFTIDPHEATAMRMLLLSSLNRTGNAQEPLGYSRHFHQKICCFLTLALMTW